MIGLRPEFRMVLDGHEPRMVGNFDDFHEGAVGTGSHGNHAGMNELFPVVRIEFVAVTVPFADVQSAVGHR